MVRRNVLIFPAGSESAIDAFKSIRDNLHFEVYGASGKHDHAEYIYPSEKLYVSEDLYVTSSNFVPSLNSLTDKWRIDFIIPAHDTVARALMEHQAMLHAVVVCSPLETAITAENKKLMYEKLSGCSYCPEIYTRENAKYPAFLKPYISAGGKGTKIINDPSGFNDDCIVCEYLPGREYTVDCFTNSKRELLFIGPRTRENITNGVAWHSEKVPLTDEIRFIAEDLNRRFSFRGLWYFQVKEDREGRLKFMEFSARHAGTMTFYRQLGVNFTLLSLFDFMGCPVEILCNDFGLKLDRGIETLFKAECEYDCAYLDYDDTMIIDGRVNTDLMKFAYQCVNRRVRLVLLSAHEGDIYASMKEHRINPELFDEIITIPPGARKSDYISEGKAIFIDNYFPSRLEVFKRLGIPVFDADAFGCLVQYSE